MIRAYLNLRVGRFLLGSFFALLLSSNNVTRVVRNATTEFTKLVATCRKLLKTSRKLLSVLSKIGKIEDNSNDSFKLAANNKTKFIMVIFITSFHFSLN